MKEITTVTIAERVERILRDTGALLEGHFELTSGRHSSGYVQCARALQYPQHAEALGRWIAAEVRHSEIDVVVSPAIGGIIIGHEVARALGVRALFGERQAGSMTLRRGQELHGGERVLVVEDVTTTGGSVRDVIHLVESWQGQVTGVGTILDRSGGDLDFGVPQYALATLLIEHYAPESCPLCRQGSRAEKPGSRQR